jgi:hypothetical protein
MVEFSNPVRGHACCWLPKSAGIWCRNLANQITDQFPRRPWLGSSLLGLLCFGFSRLGLGFSAFLGFLEAIALRLDFDDLGSMREPINQCHGACRVREHLIPFAEWLVCRNQDGLSRLVATRHDFDTPHAIHFACATNAPGLPSNWHPSAIAGAAMSPPTQLTRAPVHAVGQGTDERASLCLNGAAAGRLCSRSWFWLGRAEERDSREFLGLMPRRAMAVRSRSPTKGNAMACPYHDALIQAFAKAGAHPNNCNRGDIVWGYTHVHGPNKPPSAGPACINSILVDVEKTNGTVSLFDPVAQAMGALARLPVPISEHPHG